MKTDLKKLNRACLVTLVVTAVVTGALASIHLSDQRRIIREENAVLSKQSVDLSAAENSLARVAALLEATRRQVAMLNERIPPNADIGKFIKQLQVRLQDREIQLLNLVPLEVEASRRYKKVPLKLELTGAFVNVFELIHDLETMPRMVRIEKLTIARTGDQALALCRVRLRMAVFERSEAIEDKLRKMI